MPIKFGEISNAQMFYQDFNGEYKPLGEIEECELTVSADESDHKSYCLLEKSMELTATISSNIRALWIFVTTGNDLYLKFPKKLRRRRNR